MLWASYPSLETLSPAVDLLADKTFLTDRTHNIPQPNTRECAHRIELYNDSSKSNI